MITSTNSQNVKALCKGIMSHHTTLLFHTEFRQLFRIFQTGTWGPSIFWRSLFSIPNYTTGTGFRCLRIYLIFDCKWSIYNWYLKIIQNNFVFQKLNLWLKKKNDFWKICMKLNTIFIIKYLWTSQENI